MYFFLNGKRTEVSTDGERFLQPMDTRNTRGNTSAWLNFRGLV